MNHPADTKRNTAFLAVSPESYGMVPDAKPLAADRILIAAAGCQMDDGSASPLLEAPGGGAARVLADLFPMLSGGEENEELLRATFGACREPENHLLGQYCAVLTEAVSFDYLSKYAARVHKREQTTTAVTTAVTAATAEADADRDRIEPERACRELTSSLQVSLDHLKSALTDAAADRSLPVHFRDDCFRVAFLACCVTPGAAPGSYVLDVFSAGSFRLFLWDADGLSCIRTEDDAPLSLDSDASLRCRRVRLDHPAPFALALLSDGVCGFGHTGRGETGGEGARWLRDRLKLEERLHRVILTAAGVDTLGAQARRHLGGLAVGLDSVSGGFLIPAADERGADSAFEDFRQVCRRRSGELQELLALLPESYEETASRGSRSCADNERAFAADLFRAKPALADRLTDRLTAYVTARLDDPAAGADDAEWGPFPAGSEDPLHRLTGAEVRRTFRRYDAENDADREQAAKNRALIERMLREHWVTLRPLLCGQDSPLTDPVPAAAAQQGDRMFDRCSELSERLNALLTERRARLNAVTELLARVGQDMSDSGEDWAAGGGDASVLHADMRLLTDQLPVMADGIRAEWAESTERYLALRSEYLMEREALFAFDTQPAPDGELTALFGSSLRCMTDGTMTAAQWQTCLDRVSAADAEGSYADMFRVLPVISERIAVLDRAMRRRDVRRRCIRELTEQSDWLFICLRAAVYRDTAWGDDVGDLIDEGTRIDYQSVVRRWHDEDALFDRRRAAYNDAVRLAARFGDGL